MPDLAYWLATAMANSQLPDINRKTKEEFIADIKGDPCKVCKKVKHKKRK